MLLVVALMLVLCCCYVVGDVDVVMLGVDIDVLLLTGFFLTCSVSLK